MRDAFGGSFMIRIFLIFIIIYVGFTAIALNYAKAFKVKDLVVSYLEDNEITDIPHMSDKDFMAMKDYFDKEVVGGLHYTHPFKLTGNLCPENAYCFEDIGIIIEKTDPSEQKRNKIGVYYKVTTFFGYNIAFFRKLTALGGNNSPDNYLGNWKIVGETRTIVKE